MIVCRLLLLGVYDYEFYMKPTQYHCLKITLYDFTFVKT